MNRKTHCAVRGLLLAAFFSAPFLSSDVLAAQCAMCRSSLTNSAEGLRWSRGINAGIMLLLLAPFLISGLIAIRIYSRQVNSALLKLVRQCRGIPLLLRQRAQRAAAGIAAWQSGHGGA